MLRNKASDCKLGSYQDDFAGDDRLKIHVRRVLCIFGGATCFANFVVRQEINSRVGKRYWGRNHFIRYQPSDGRYSQIQCRTQSLMCWTPFLTETWCENGNKNVVSNERKSTGSLKTSITYHPTHTFPASDHRFFVFKGQWSRDQDDH